MGSIAAIWKVYLFVLELIINSPVEVKEIRRNIGKPNEIHHVAMLSASGTLAFLVI